MFLYSWKVECWLYYILYFFLTEEMIILDSIIDYKYDLVELGRNVIALCFKIVTTDLV